MFELENNRGKDLTNMEKLKSYFMYQTYIYSDPEEIESNIEYISNIFKLIYLIINDIKFNEDSVLIYNCHAYINGFQYRTIEDIKNVFKKSKNKINWIRQFIRELHTTFSNIKKLEQSNDVYWKDLNELEPPAFIYSFIIKGYKYFGDNPKKLSLLFHILEIVIFRYRLINSRADIISRINEILMKFKGDLTLLCNHFNSKLNESWYWSYERAEEYLNGVMFGNSVIHYLLWKYENSIQNKHYKIKKVQITNEQIEHISPQKPPNGDKIASGYQVNKEQNYNEDFIKYYLHCFGNLMLISDSHNSSIGNKPFKEKLDTYINNPLLKHQAEIRNFISGTIKNPKWDKKAINKRHKRIAEFCLNKWNFENLKID